MYTKCAYLVTLSKIQPVPVGQYAKAHLLLFREQPISPKSHTAPYSKRDSPAQLSCLPRYRAGKLCRRARMRADALGLHGPPPPLVVLFQAQWLWRGAAKGNEAWRGEARRGEAWGSEARRGEARRVGVCNLPKRLQRGVYGTASTAWRGAASTARRLWRGAVRRILRLCCARTLFPIKSVQRSRTSM